ncbi:MULTISPECIES: hypothetical protein [Arthrobacter]|uniref:Uncharacterized protein n=1 Tax=Arthrobacter oryzae TaxID=409290 RepID=A0A3N0BMJ2_9MICC|nr:MULTISPECIES: hypothetical protein [Arthrobacter]RNL49960.1 hypothetical protein D7003_17715 [Arthrobacter oryzae]
MPGVAAVFVTGAAGAPGTVVAAEGTTPGGAAGGTTAGGAAGGLVVAAFALAAVEPAGADAGGGAWLGAAD